MAKLIIFSRYVIAAVLLSAAGMTISYAQSPAPPAGGYDGVIAPAEPDNAQENNAAGNNTGAPSADTPDDKPSAGYSPDVAVAPYKEPEGKEVQPPSTQFTPVPSQAFGTQGNKTPGTVDGPKVDFSGARHTLIQGKPEIVFAAENAITRAMTSVNDKNLSDADRAKKTQEAYTSLSSLANGIRVKQKTPDSVYKQMNLSDAYISEERADDAVALKELDDALASMKPAQ